MIITVIGILTWIAYVILDHTSEYTSNDSLFSCKEKDHARHS